MAGTIAVERAHWLGFRWQRQGLDGQAGENVLDDLLLLGFQDSRQSGARLSLIQRTSKIGTTRVENAISPNGPLVSLWSVRGAPHAHRVTQLDFARDAFAIQETDDGGPAYVEAVQEVAAALTAVVTAPTSKSQASSEVTSRVSPRLVQWCARCEADHVPDALFRAAGRQAQLVLGPEEQRTTMLHPTPDHPQEKVNHPRRRLLDVYFRVNGPTSRPLFRDWIESDVNDLWKDLAGDLVRVQVDNRRYDVPELLLAELEAAPKAEGIVLVPPHDPYLRQVDRTLLVPDSGRRRQVWRALSAPGALLVDGEVAGVWRYRRSERKVTITPFEALTTAQRKKAERSAQLIAQATGDEEPAITWE